MAEPKPIASLSSSLLARKGQARPAMRPQGFASFGTLPQAVDDLGWNDMGHDAGPAVPTPEAELPPVLVARGKLAEEVADAPEPAPAAKRRVADATVARIDADARAKTGKAAFTLRLEPDRHLRLRLACAVRHASAQALVTEALDRFLDTLPEIDALARRLPSHRRT